MKIEIYRRKDGKWSWRVRSTVNGRIMATDGQQGYSRRIDAASTARAVTGDSLPLEVIGGEMYKMEES